MFVAGTDVDIENKARRGHRIGVVAMARTPRLLGIVAQGRPFLMAVKRLDRRIDVENPGLGEQRLHAILKVLTQPGGAFRLVDRLEGAPDRVLADDLLHPQELRQHSVTAQRRDMRVALVAGEHGEHRRSCPCGRRWLHGARFIRGMLWWVSTVSTPGACSAAVVSIDMIRPLAMLLWTIAAWAAPGTEISAVYRAPPVTFRRPSTREIGCPTAFMRALPRFAARAKRRAAQARP